MKLKHGIVYSASSGNLSGAIVAGGKNGSVLYTRTRKKNMVSNSASQHKVFFKRVSQLWRSASASNVSKWNNYAASVSKLSIFGVRRAFTGYQLFFHYNFDRMLAGSSPSTSFSFLSDNFIINLDHITANASLLSLRLYYTPSSFSSNSLLIFATKPLPAGKVPVKSDYKFIARFNGNTTSPRNIYSFYRLIFGDVLVSGLYVYIKFRQYCPSGYPYYPTSYFNCKIA